MFHPIRYQGFAVYDVRRLIVPKSALEERIYLEALHRIPVAFQLGPEWGEERQPGTIWIDEEAHDRTYQQVRAGFRSDAGFILRTSRAMRRDLDELKTRIEEARRARGDWELAPLAEACAGAVAWFCLNWLHPFQAVRMAIARLAGPDRVDCDFARLLRPGEPALLLRAYEALADAGDGAAEPEWAAVVSRGDQHPDSGRADHEAGSRARRTLLEACARTDGAGAAELLAAQLDLVRLIVWHEEERHLLQQQFYGLARSRGTQAGGKPESARRSQTAANHEGEPRCGSR